MAVKGFKNCNILVEGKEIINTSLEIKNGKISAIGNIEDDGFITLPENLIVVPGFIDEHIHGACGADAMDADKAAYDKMTTALTAEGTTSFLFTTMTVEKSKIISTLKVIADYVKNPNPLGATPLGVHLEGPFISAKFNGAQNEADILTPDVKVLNEFIDASDNNIRLITFSYKKEYLPFLKEVVKRGIVPSLGHTDCTVKEALEAIRCGVKCGTHTFNAMRGVHHRDIGTAGALLLDKSVNCEVIADLFHVSEEALQLLYQCKGNQRIILITDSLEAKYMPDGVYSLGGNKVFVKGNEARLEDGTIAASVLKMNEAVRNVKKVMNISLEEAVNMATINSATNLKINDKKGAISVGKDADFAIIDREVNVIKTVIGGNVVYER